MNPRATKRISKENVNEMTGEARQGKCGGQETRALRLG